MECLPCSGSPAEPRWRNASRITAAPDGRQQTNHGHFAAEEGPYPGEDVIISRSIEACVTALETYTGQVYEERALDVVPLYPMADGWSFDRVLTCVGVGLLENTLLPVESTGSIRAA